MPHISLLFMSLECSKTQCCIVCCYRIKVATFAIVGNKNFLHLLSSPIEFIVATIVVALV